MWYCWRYHVVTSVDEGSLPCGACFGFEASVSLGGAMSSKDLNFPIQPARCSSVVSAFAHGAMGRRIDPSWAGPIELFLVPACAPRLV